MKIVSACLAGVRCRYDGKDSLNPEVVELVKAGEAVPVCPEQLGGLPTPRPCCEIVGDRVVTAGGMDVTQNFLRGAEEACRIGELCGASEAVLKSGSPSCGCGEVYDGTFSGRKIPGDGLFAAMLRERGIKVKAV